MNAYAGEDLDGRKFHVETGVVEGRGYVTLWLDDQRVEKLGPGDIAHVRLDDRGAFNLGRAIAAAAAAVLAESER